MLDSIISFLNGLSLHASAIHVYYIMYYIVDLQIITKILLQLLPVPELIPFRYTPQLRGLMAPLSVQASLQGPMSRAMAALVNSKQILLAVLDAFVTEPTLDWCKYARKHNSKGNTTFLKNYPYIPCPHIIFTGSSFSPYSIPKKNLN